MNKQHFNRSLEVSKSTIEKKNGFPKDHWTLKTGSFDDPTPATQVQPLPLEGPKSLGFTKKNIPDSSGFDPNLGVLSDLF